MIKHSIRVQLGNFHICISCALPSLLRPSTRCLPSALKWKVIQAKAWVLFVGHGHATVGVSPAFSQAVPICCCTVSLLAWSRRETPNDQQSMYIFMVCKEHSMRLGIGQHSAPYKATGCAILLKDKNKLLLL